VAWQALTAAGLSRASSPPSSVNMTPASTSAIRIVWTGSPTQNPSQSKRQRERPLQAALATFSARRAQRGFVPTGFP
jgi:hypothetical protein